MLLRQLHSYFMVLIKLTAIGYADQCRLMKLVNIRRTASNIRNDKGGWPHEVSIITECIINIVNWKRRADSVDDDQATWLA